jgi:hypothetical protein
MNIYATRGSVAAGDDGDAPHGRSFNLPDGTPLQDVLKHIQAARYLPSISGGLATWSVASNRPVAVLAQQWAEPKMVATFPEDLQGLDWKDGTLRLHFNYHAQIDPDSVCRVFWGYRLNAI